MMAMACVGVGGWLGGCVWVRVEERMACVCDGGSSGGCVWVRVEDRMADRACLPVGCMFDYIIASSLFLR